MAGVGAWQPLSTFRIRDFVESMPRGGYVVRVLHILDADGYRTRVHFRELEPEDAIVRRPVEEAG